MLICILGQDGSGKSTQAQLLFTALSELEFECVYSHTIDYATVRTDIIKPENIYKIRYLLFFWPFYVLVDHFISYRRKFSGTHQIHISDRYFYDKFINFVHLGITRSNVVNNFYLRYLARLITKPDLVFLIDAKPEDCFERKKEHTLEKCKLLRDLYRDLMRRHFNNEVVLDGTLSIDAIHKQILNEVLKHTQNIQFDSGLG